MLKVKEQKTPYSYTSIRKKQALKQGNCQRKSEKLHID